MPKELHWNPATTTPLHSIWTFGINTCHAALWLRDDFFAQMNQMKRQLAFRYVRCHGLLNDDLVTINADGQSFDFTGTLTALRRMRQAGYLPFCELSSMPSALSRGSTVSTAYQFRCDPPRDWEMWRLLIRGLMEALQQEFGIAELRRWYFEVWNEPDLSPWFWTGTRDEYFQLYDIAREEVKRTDARLRAGGPATSRTMWMPEFLEHCAPKKNDGWTCDFLSTHAYPSDVPFLNGDGMSDAKLRPASLLRELFAKVKRTRDAAGGNHLPLIAGEWNSSAGPLAWNHDECGNAALVCKTMAELSDSCEGSIFWNATDIYEECGFHYAPFHGGYGLVTVNNIPKAAHHAFRFLSRLKGRRIDCSFTGPVCEEHGTIGAIAADGTLRIVLWNYREPDTAGRPLEFRLPDFHGTATLESVLPGEGSAYEVWRELGSPDYATLPVLTRLTRASRCRKTAMTGGTVASLPPGSAALLRIPTQEA